MNGRRLPWKLPAALIVAVLVVGCGEEDFQRDIDAVRQARTIAPDETNDEVARRIAGPQGRVDWTAKRIGDYPDYEDAVGVVAHIDRVTRAGTKRPIELSFIYDRTQADVSFQLLGIDGQSMLVAGDWLQMLLAE